MILLLTLSTSLIPVTNQDILRHLTEVVGMELKGAVFRYHIQFKSLMAVDTDIYHEGGRGQEGGGSVRSI